MQACLRCQREKVVPVTLDAPSIFAVTLSVIVFTATESPTATAFGGPRANVIAIPPACVSIWLWSFAFTVIASASMLPPVTVAETFCVIVLPAPLPAPEKLKPLLPPLVTAAAMPSAHVVICAVDVA